MEYCHVSGRRRPALFAVASILTSITLLDSVAPFTPSLAPLWGKGQQRRLFLDPTDRRRTRSVGQVLILFSSTAESSSSSPSSSTSTTPSAVTLPETAPLPPHTFAGQVEQALMEKFGAASIDRVLQSWRLLERDYVHRQYVGPAASESSSSSTSSQCHQLAHSYVPGLTVQEFWDPQQFAWCQKLQSKFGAIRDEFLRVTAHPETLAAQGNVSKPYL